MTGFLLAVLSPVILYAGGRTLNNLPPRVRLAIARVNPLLMEENYRQAADILEQYLAPKAPADETDASGYHHPEIYFVLGNCYLMLARYEEAEDAYRKAVRRDPAHTSAWLNRARTLYEMKKLKEAGHCFVKAYETATEKKPDHLYYAALSCLMAADPEQSLTLFERLMAAHPSAMKPEWKENLVHALLAADRARQALPHIRDLVNVYTGEKQVQWQEILLYQYVQLEMKKAALDLARSLTQSAPEIDKWWKALVSIHLSEGRYEKALAALIPYSFLTPLTRKEKQLMADLSLELGIPVKAAPVYEDCLKKSPDKKLLRRLALAYRQLGRPETALERIAEFRKNSNDVDMLLLAAELHYALAQYTKAAAAYRQAAEESGEHRGRAWLMAGYAAWQADQLTAAQEAFVRAAAYQSQQQSARKALKELRKVMEHR